MIVDRLYERGDRRAATPFAMKIVSWNLNGLLSCVNHGSFLPIEALEPDVVCLQEIRTKETPTVISGYRHIWNPADRDKYSGTAVLTRVEPVDTWTGFRKDEDSEGRLITLEFDSLYLVNAYVPNSQANFRRREYRLEWDEEFLPYVLRLTQDKPVVICGDFNVTRSPLDVFEENMRMHYKEQGYMSDERSNLETLLEGADLCDVFRSLHPEERSYTWWSNRKNKRALGHGWRLDYFLVSRDLMDAVKDMRHLTDITGSDHCPILLTMGG